jgi:ribonucleotide monophosphatase NagD (HAD superfamily)
MATFSAVICETANIQTWVFRHRRVLMAGDFIRSDIQDALDFRYCSALLLTGVTTLDMLAQFAVMPDLVFETLG